MKLYDPKANRLVYLSQQATKEFWDEHWDHRKARLQYPPKVSPFNFVVSQTRRFLPPGSLVIEGGAGLALSSWFLHQSGYKTIAIDFATQTIQRLKETIPEVSPLQADVRNLPLESGKVDGYWSLGVIEHFYDGYDEIRNEMRRVLRLGGILFLTFPYMNRFRRYKARTSKYPIWKETPEQKEHFYQFALDEKRVTADFQAHGFKLIAKAHIDANKGIKGELNFATRQFQTLYDSHGLAAKITRRMLDVLLGPLASHGILLVLQKTA